MHRFSQRSELSAVIELRARQKRSALTASEQKLWAEIRGGRLGVSFRRQVPLGNYIADFAAPASKLVVEVDGAYHARHQSADTRRDRSLRRLGYRVLRLEASLVEQHLEVAVARSALPSSSSCDSQSSRSPAGASAPSASFWEICRASRARHYDEEGFETINAWTDHYE